ncbi:hypothetical protein WA158_007069 [Blastocystis sp. Blastoise]
MDVDIGAFLRRIPPITRFMLSISVGLAVLTTLRPEYSYYLYFSKDLFLRKHEIWRLFTGFFYFGKLSINLCINIYVFWNYSQQLELNSFYNKRADYLWCVFLSILMITTCALFFPFSILLGNSLITTLLYIWARKNPFIHVQLFVVPMTAPYLPWAFALMSTITNETIPTPDLIGIFCGHVYYYFSDVLPKVAKLRGWKKQEFITAPSFLSRLLGDDVANDNIQEDEDANIRQQEQLFEQMERQNHED